MTKEEQDKLDEIYHELWNLVDEVSQIKISIVDLGERLKPYVSDDCFKLGFKK